MTNRNRSRNYEIIPVITELKSFIDWLMVHLVLILLRNPSMMIVVQLVIEAFTSGVGCSSWTKSSTSSSPSNHPLSLSFTYTLNFTPIDFKHSNRKPQWRVWTEHHHCKIVYIGDIGLRNCIGLSVTSVRLWQREFDLACPKPSKLSLNLILLSRETTNKFV